MWLNTLRTAITTHIGMDATLLIAVSGGGDSVALVRGCVALQEELRLRVVVAHLDHGLRHDSADDASFVGKLALELNVMCLRERLDVAAWAQQNRRNLEDAARQLRYTMLEQAAQAVGAKAILVAHSADDQAETVLMHLLRGAGLDGLTGMAPLGPSPIPSATTPIFRPLLGVTREELREWLTDNGYTWREDSTNTDTSRLRSAMRHRTLPFLAESFPRIRETLGRTAAVLTADADLLNQLADEGWQLLATTFEGRVRLPRMEFLAQPIALQRRLLRRAYHAVQTRQRELTSEHVTTALALAANGTMNQRATLPGGAFLTIAHDGLWVEIPQEATPNAPVALPSDGTLTIGSMTLEIHPVMSDALPQNWTQVPRSETYLDADTLALPLTVRSPRPDDHWQPLGMNGKSVNLRDWMAKQKVPLAIRDSMPLVVDANDQIVWVVAWRNSHMGRVTEHTQNVLHIAYSVNKGE